MRYRLVLLLASCASVFIGNFERAEAAPILFTDRTSFEAASGPLSTITFEGFREGSLCDPFSGTFEPCVFSTGGVTFTSTLGLPENNQNPLLSIDDMTVTNSKGLMSSAISLDPDDFTLDFSGYSFAFDFVQLAGYPPSMFDILLTEVDGTETIFSLLTDPTNVDFFGATSDVGFSHAAIWSSEHQSGRSNFIIDNVSTDAATAPAPVPEPSTMLLFGSGAAYFLRRFKRRDGNS